MGRLDKQIKALVAELKKSKRKKQKGKKKAKKQGKPKKTLAEYAKEKMLMDMLTKQSGGGGGGGAPLRVANYDTEVVKKELADLKEKAKDEKSKVNEEVKRLESGMEQYKRQLMLEYKEQENPRALANKSGFIGGDGEMISMDKISDVYDAVQSQIMGLTKKISELEAQKQMVVAEIDLKEIEQQQEEVQQKKEKLENVQRLVDFHGKMTFNQMIDYERQAESFLREQRAQRRATSASASSSSSTPMGPILIQTPPTQPLPKTNTPKATTPTQSQASRIPTRTSLSRGSTPTSSSAGTRYNLPPPPINLPRASDIDPSYAKPKRLIREVANLSQ